ncbi:hypothetical protein D9M69_283440 [compost metagenome]
MSSLGLHLEEAKSLLGRLQRTMVAAQVAEAVARTGVCPPCGAQLACKGHHHLVFRSALGRLSIDSPRLYPFRFVESAVNQVVQSASDSSNGSRWLGGLSTRTTYCKSGPRCSITSSGLTLNDGIPPFLKERATALPLSQPPVWRGLRAMPGAVPRPRPA